MAHLRPQELREKGICKSINGIMYNHESKYRKEHFVTQKICKSVAEIYSGKRKLISLGNLEILKDLSYANDLISSVKFGMIEKLWENLFQLRESLEDWKIGLVLHLVV